jgi:two-component system sensor histidine kinase UhpB
MSLRTSLNLLITGLLLLVMILGTLLLLRNAREQVRAEVESVSTMVIELANPASNFFSIPEATAWTGQSSLRGLEHLRHIRIELQDRQGAQIYSNFLASGRGSQERPPQWFQGLMTRNLIPIRIERDIHSGDRWMGKVVIEADPSYEVAEVWNDTVGLFWLVAVFFLAVNILVYWAVGRSLKPVGRILEALNELERGNLEARLPPFKLKELSSISEKFNGMAQTLQASISRNHRLSQQLIYLQEEERKSLARDLHDEMGQCLTAILADGTALLRLSEDRFPEARASAQAVVDVSHHLMALLRAMLQRLRPDVLDGVGLLPALEELVVAWRQRNPRETCISKYTSDLNGLCEASKITAYRVVQECLTNISRHAHARRVRLEAGKVSARQGESVLRLCVEDDGLGFDPARAEGFGLSGMRERVEGLGGRFELMSSVGSGTRVTVTIPVKAEARA